MKHKWFFFLLLLICIISRLITTIYYIEDIDCLRFALSAYHYDVPEMRPHFPGYAVYCFLLKVMFSFTGHLAISFSIMGGIGIFFVILASLGLLRTFAPALPLWPATLILFLNPQLWVMSNSYMPDLFGLGMLMAALYLFCRAWQEGGYWLWYFQLLTGLLAGTRLSYIPMLLLPEILLLWKYKSQSLKQIAVAAFSVSLWLVPLVILTGWQYLIEAAQVQAEGHFTRWGGSVISSHATILQRVVSALQSAWADGLGGWWPGRELENMGLSVLLLLLLFAGFFSVIKWIKYPPAKDRSRLAFYLFISIGIYLLWAFFFQNIVHKPRHMMPVVPVLCLLMTIGFEKIRKNFPATGIAVFIIFIGLNSMVTFTAICHHLQPTAIAQMKDDLLQQNSATGIFVGSGVMGYYMEKHYWQGQVLDIDSNSAPIVSGYNKGNTIFSTAPLDGMLAARAVKITDFYHDPFVNRMWSHLTLYQYHR